MFYLRFKSIINRDLSNQQANRNIPEEEGVQDDIDDK